MRSFPHTSLWRRVGIAVALIAVPLLVWAAPVDLVPRLKFKRDVVELPFKARSNDQLIVPATLGGREGDWLIDTNFFISVVHDLPAKARWFDYTRYTWTVQFGAEQKELPVVHFDKLVFDHGSVSVKGFAVSSPMAGPPVEGAPRFAGIVGLDVLRAGRAVIDYETRTVVLHARDVPEAEVAGTADETAVRLPLLLCPEKQFAVICSVAGNRFALIVDTGSQHSIVSKAIAAAASSRSLPGIAQWTYAGMVDFERVAVTDFAIGPLHLPEQTLLVGDAFSQFGLKVDGIPIVGVLGADILARHQGRIDLGHSLLFLKPKA